MFQVSLSRRFTHITHLGAIVPCRGLEEHLNDPNFEQNRIEYKSNKDAADKDMMNGRSVLKKGENRKPLNSSSSMAKYLYGVAHISIIYPGDDSSTGGDSSPGHNSSPGRNSSPGGNSSPAPGGDSSPGGSSGGDTKS
jgi:hypothetical protein